MRIQKSTTTMNTSENISTTFHTIRDETYAVTDTGDGDTAVLLMHGWPDDRSIWRYQIPVLWAAGYRVVAVDWIGHGESSIPKDPKRYRVPEVSKDLDALLDSLEIDQCHLVAHDYGATVCWEFAAEYTHRLYSYCALSVGPSIEIVVDILRGNLFHYYWLVLHGFDSLSRWVYLRNNNKRYHKRFSSHPDANRILERLHGDGDQTFWTIWERANPSHEVLLRWLRSGRKKKIAVPTMGIYSHQDEWMTIDQMSRGYRHVSAQWRFEVLNSGHWLQLESPEEVNPILLNWLSEVR
ncbi:MAG: alpha/beta hydrolase [Chloroflexota bacterium]